MAIKTSGIRVVKRVVGATVGGMSTGRGTTWGGMQSSASGPTRADSGLFRVPVGVGPSPGRGEVFTVPGVPKIRQPVRIPTAKVPAQVTGRNSPLLPGVIPRVPHHTLPPVTTRGAPTSPPSQQQPPSIPKEVPVALDLGNLLNTAALVYGKVQTAKYSQPAPMYSQPMGASYPQRNVGVFDSVPQMLGWGADSSAVVIDEMGNACLPIPPRGYRYNQKGELYKVGRRRRRRLATASDIADLGALDSVTTQSQKKAWIATHPS